MTHHFVNSPMKKADVDDTHRKIFGRHRLLSIIAAIPLKIYGG